jgi:raffinose/stachyose/melibiose transport system permease protein
MGPALILFSVTMLIPFCLGAVYSLTSWDGVSTSVVWVGLNNYAAIFRDESFLRSFSFTFRYTFVVVALQNSLAFFFALLLTQRIFLRNGVRTMLFLPNMIAGVLLGFIWQFIFLKGFPSIGEITHIRFFQQEWLGTAATGFWALVIVSVWRMTGYLMVIYVAGLATVPQELIECASIDGAAPWQRLWKVKVPLIVPTFTVSLFISIAWEFKLFDINYSLTKGGPFDSTKSVALDIYNEAFINSRYGLGTAKSIIFLFVVAVITLIQVKVTSKREVQL